jgi:hypothetical protein
MLSSGHIAPTIIRAIACPLLPPPRPLQEYSMQELVHELTALRARIDDVRVRL